MYRAYYIKSYVVVGRCQPIYAVLYWLTELPVNIYCIDLDAFDGVVLDLVTVSIVAVLAIRTLRRLCCSCVCCQWLQLLALVLGDTSNIN